MSHRPLDRHVSEFYREETLAPSELAAITAAVDAAGAVPPPGLLDRARAVISSPGRALRLAALSAAAALSIGLAVDPVRTAGVLGIDPSALSPWLDGSGEPDPYRGLDFDRQASLWAIMATNVEKNAPDHWFHPLPPNDDPGSPGTTVGWIERTYGTSVSLTGGPLALLPAGVRILGTRTTYGSQDLDGLTGSVFGLGPIHWLSLGAPDESRSLLLVAEPTGFLPRELVDRFEVRSVGARSVAIWTEFGAVFMLSTTQAGIAALASRLGRSALLRELPPGTPFDRGGSDELLAIRDPGTGKSSIVDSAGRVRGAEFDQVEDAGYRRALVRVGSRWGLFVHGAGLVAPISYERLTRSGDQFYAACRDGRCGFLRSSGQELFPFRFAAEDLPWAMGGLMTPAREGGLWGILDWGGNWVIRPCFEEVKPLDPSDREAPVLFALRRGELWGVLHTLGRNLQPWGDTTGRYPTYEQAPYLIERDPSHPDEGDEPWIIQPRYEAVEPGTGGKWWFRVQQAGVWTNLSTYMTRHAAPPPAGTPAPYRSPDGPVPDGDGFRLVQEGLIRTPRYDAIELRVATYSYAVRAGDKWGLVGYHGKPILPVELDAIRDWTSPHLLWVSRRGHWNVVDGRGDPLFAADLEPAGDPVWDWAPARVRDPASGDWIAGYLHWSGRFVTIGRVFQVAGAVDRDQSPSLAPSTR